MLRWVVFFFGQAITNPNWNPNTLNNDITLLKLSSPARLGARVSPVCLAPANLAVPTNLQCVTTGWGRISTSCTYAAASGRAVGGRRPSRGLCKVRGCPGWGDNLVRTQGWRS